MNKRGQFFLIAALVIVGIIVTLGAINISTKAPAEENTAFYDLSKEINFESSQLVDYGVYNGSSPEEISQSVTSLVSNYSAENPDTEMLFAYGTASSMAIVSYAPAQSNVMMGSTAGTPVLSTKKTVYSKNDIDISNGEVTVKLNDGSELKFNLAEGENFFIRLEQKIGENTYVATE